MKTVGLSLSKAARQNLFRASFGKGELRAPEHYSPAAQRLYEKYGVRRTKRVRDVEYLLAVDEEPHVRPHVVLLVDHAEAQAGV